MNPSENIFPDALARSRRYYEKAKSYPEGSGSKVKGKSPEFYFKQATLYLSRQGDDYFGTEDFSYIVTSQDLMPRHWKPTLYQKLNGATWSKVLVEVKEDKTGRIIPDEEIKISSYERNALRVEVGSRVYEISDSGVKDMAASISSSCNKASALVMYAST